MPPSLWPGYQNMKVDGANPNEIHILEQGTTANLQTYEEEVNVITFESLDYLLYSTSKVD